ncbi:hypothetical protein JKP88DRAFT_347317 [Tribonema minus]|uniref:Uncharacterized protein n=1 Tax=Tribonema minus TaxID=303371 RepID=A0A835ZE51_9STRA|nr:hypothetical protein JKP88DRAFT_347317 [Tribonema minus]
MIVPSMTALLVLVAGQLTTTSAAEANATTSDSASYFTSSTSSWSLEPAGTKYKTKKDSANINLYQDDQDKENCSGTSMSFSVTAENDTYIPDGETAAASTTSYISYDLTTLRQCADGEASSSTYVFNSTSSGYIESVPTGCCSDRVSLWGSAGAFSGPSTSDGAAGTGSSADTATQQGGEASGADSAQPNVEVTGTGAKFAAALSGTFVLSDTSSWSSSSGGSGANTGKAEDVNCTVEVAMACGGTATLESGETSERCTLSGCTKSTVTEEKEFCATPEDLGSATATGTVKIPSLNINFDLADLPEGVTLRVRAAKYKSEHDTVAV